MIDTIRKFLPDHDVEGDATGWAVFTKDRRRRLALGRSWTPELGQPRNKLAIFCGLNPSSAGAHENDMTVTKEVEFTRRLGGSSYLKVNLYPWISTDPRGLEVPEARLVTLDASVAAIVGIACNADVLMVAAWGASPYATPERIAVMREIMLCQPLVCLGKTRDGSPRHPSRLPYATELEAWP